MRGRRVRAAGLLGVLALTGCATITYDAGMVETMVAMNRVAAAGSFERLGGFEVSQRPVFAIAELLTVVDAKLEEALSRELSRTGGDAVINLRIHEEYDIIDFAIGAAQGFLIGVQLVQTRSVTLQGDVVRWTGGEDAELEEALAKYCRAIEIATEDGASRTGHVCVQKPGQALGD